MSSERLLKRLLCVLAVVIALRALVAWWLGGSLLALALPGVIVLALAVGCVRLDLRK